MKTVAGAVTDSVPVSLSKAAKILSKFTSADNGATPAFLHYLMRASDAFNELVQLHKELNGSGSERSRSKKHRSGIQVENSVGNYADATRPGAVDGERLELGEVNGVLKKEGDNMIGDSVDSKRGKKEKKKIKMELSEEGRSNGGLGISNGVKEDEFEGKKSKKVKNGSEVELEVRDDEIEKKSSKKRKSGEIGVDGEGTDSAKKEGESTIGVRVDSKTGKKEKKKIKKELSEEGRSNGGHGISNGVKEEEIEGKKNKKVKRGGEVELEVRDGEIEKKSSKKRKSGEIAVDGEGTDSANKGMQIKKRKKVKSEVDN